MASLSVALPVGDRDHLGAQQPHPGHVQRLPAGVLLAHVDDALQAEQGGGRRGGHAVLAGAGLGDDPGLAHPPGQQGLAEDIVDLVRAGVGQVLALEEHPAAARRGGEPRHLGQQRRPPRVAGGQRGQLGLEGRVGLGRRVRVRELGQGRHQRLGRQPPAEPAEVPRAVGDARPGRPTRSAALVTTRPAPGWAREPSGHRPGGRRSQGRRPWVAGLGVGSAPARPAPVAAQRRMRPGGDQVGHRAARVLAGDQALADQHRVRAGRRVGQQVMRAANAGLGDLDDARRGPAGPAGRRPCGRPPAWPGCGR